MALPRVAGPEEPLGRYLTEASYFSRTKNLVESKAFMPPDDLHLSVYRMDGLTAGEIWDIGEKVASDATTAKRLYGRADINVSTCRESGLEVDFDDEPPRHASIVGWPEAKEAQKLMAEELAADAVPVFR